MSTIAPYCTVFCMFGGNYIILKCQNFNKLLVQNVKIKIKIKILSKPTIWVQVEFSVYWVFFHCGYSISNRKVINKSFT
jgi:hypothetical protein